MSDSANKHPTILLVDDQPTTLRLLSEILKTDYTVLAATNGTEALLALNNSITIDLILLDIIMPDQNGFEVLQKIRDYPGYKKTPVIFLTALGEEHNEAKGFAAGAADYIIKPISPLRLLARVKNQLELQHQRQLLTEKNKELQDAMEQISTLRGILPICSFCKQIRTDDGYWQKVEHFVSNHSQVKFSHSICPECLAENYPGVTQQG